VGGGQVEAIFKEFATIPANPIEKSKTQTLAASTFLKTVKLQ
jgi:hypothetical protein